MKLFAAVAVALALSFSAGTVDARAQPGVSPYVPGYNPYAGMRRTPSSSTWSPRYGSRAYVGFRRPRARVYSPRRALVFPTYTSGRSFWMRY